MGRPVLRYELRNRLEDRMLLTDSKVAIWWCLRDKKLSQMISKRAEVVNRNIDIEKEQAGTELGQAQLKLGLDFSLIICKFGFSHLD